jgi:hypothetical protein
MAEETLRLLGARDYPAAVISAVTHLDALLREALEKDETLPGRAYAADPAAHSKLLIRSDHPGIHEWIRVRNMVIHS